MFTFILIHIFAKNIFKFHTLKYNYTLFSNSLGHLC